MRPIDADALIATMENMRSISNNVKQRQIEESILHGIVPQIIDDAPTLSVKQDTELSSILQDYGIKDTDTLRYILDQYQKIIVDITGGQMSYLTYPAETVIACADDNYRKCHEESMNHGRWIYDGDCMITSCCNTAYDIGKFQSNDNLILVPKICPNCGAKMDLKGDEEK